MSNSLFNALGGQPQAGLNNMVTQFQQFKQSFQGNPRDKVMELLSNGTISQQQLNQAQAMANQLRNILK